MKVGVNARTFSTNKPGGSVQAAKRVTKQLISDPEIDVLLFGNQSIKSEFNNVNVIDGSFEPTSGISGMVWERTILPRLAKKENLDVLFAPNGNGFLTDVDYPVVIWVHDVSNQWLGWKHRAYRKTLLPRSCKLADRIVTPSEFMKSEIDNKIGVDKSFIDVIHNGVDQYYVSDAGTSKIDLPPKYILSVSSSLEFGNRKNLSAVIDTFRLLKRHYGIDYKLVLVGPEREDITDKIPDLRDDIVVTGYVSQEELKYTYQNAGVFFYPSLHEGFGLPPLEAMASGTPVVASNAASLSEVLNGAAALTNPQDIEGFADHIHEIIRNEDLRREMSEMGEERAQKFTWERTKNLLKESFKNATTA